MNQVASAGQPNAAQSIHQTQGKAPEPQAIAETREKFAEFFGKTFYGQMLKSMRQTVGKPAYFHGGRAEEVFRSELDQTIATHLTESQGAEIAEGAFRQQLSQWADRIRQADEQSKTGEGLEQLSALRRR